MAEIKWFEKLYEYEKEKYLIGTQKELIEKTHMSTTGVSNICKFIGYRHRLIKITNDMTQEVIVGTINELSEKLDMSVLAIKKAYRKSKSLKRGTWDMVLLDEVKEELIRAPKYKSEEEAMIQMRSFNDKHKHAPKTIKENREAIQVLKSKPVKPAKWQASAYTRQLFYQCFKGWA